MKISAGQRLACLQRNGLKEVVVAVRSTPLLTAAEIRRRVHLAEFNPEELLSAVDETGEPERHLQSSAIERAKSDGLWWRCGCDGSEIGTQLPHTLPDFRPVVRASCNSVMALIARESAVADVHL